MLSNQPKKPPEFMHWEFAEVPLSREDAVRWLRQEREEENQGGVNVGLVNGQGIIEDEEDLLFSQV